MYCLFIEDSGGSWQVAVMRYLLIATLIICGSAHANMRCEGRIVQRGFTPVEVLERCGAAEYEDQRVEFLTRGVPVFVDEWTYNQGPQRFRRLLRFENGRLEKIELRQKPLP